MAVVANLAAMVEFDGWSLSSHANPPTDQLNAGLLYFKLLLGIYISELAGFGRVGRVWQVYVQP